MAVSISERLRERARIAAPHVLTRLPGSSARFGPPRKMVWSAADWVRRWNARSNPSDAAELIWVHDAVPIDRSPSIGVQGLEWTSLDVHVRERQGRHIVGPHHDGVRTFAMSMPRGRVAGYFGSVISPDDGLVVEASFGFDADDRKHPVRRQRSLGPVAHLEGTAATVASAHAEAYYHWLFDVLPRLEILRLAGWEDDRWDHLVVNTSGAAYERETLDRFGVPADRIREIRSGSQVRADRLVVPSVVGVAGHVPAWAFQVVRDRLMPAGSPTEPPGPPQRLYISRADTVQRRVADEDRLVAMLEPLGFTCLTLTGRSIDEQIDLFARAEVVVGPHGGGLTNLVWCRPGTAVVELFADDYVNPVFWALCELRGLRHHHVVGRPATPGLHRGYGAMQVDPDLVVRTVELALGSVTRVPTA